jgi:hypothetical protein
MILALFIAMMCGLGVQPTVAMPEVSILGRWQYDGFSFDNHRYPNPNPDFELTFTFTSDGKSRLYWARKNEVGFCERVAEFHVAAGHLVQRVTWVNPKNASECSKDLDMQMDRETQTQISIGEDELSLHFDLDGKPFLYILKRQH